MPSAGDGAYRFHTKPGFNDLSKLSKEFPFEVIPFLCEAPQIFRILSGKLAVRGELKRKRLQGTKLAS